MQIDMMELLFNIGKGSFHKMVIINIGIRYQPSSERFQPLHCDNKVNFC